jgi:hypothetical protein
MSVTAGLWVYVQIDVRGPSLSPRPTLTPTTLTTVLPCACQADWRVEAAPSFRALQVRHGSAVCVCPCLKRPGQEEGLPLHKCESAIRNITLPLWCCAELFGGQASVAPTTPEVLMVESATAAGFVRARPAAASDSAGGGPGAGSGPGQNRGPHSHSKHGATAGSFLLISGSVKACIIAEVSLKIGGGG